MCPRRIFFHYDCYYEFKLTPIDLQGCFRCSEEAACMASGTNCTPRYGRLATAACSERAQHSMHSTARTAQRADRMLEPRQTSRGRVCALSATRHRSLPIARAHATFATFCVLSTAVVRWLRDLHVSCRRHRVTAPGGLQSTLTCAGMQRHAWRRKARVYSPAISVRGVHVCHSPDA